MSIKRLSPEEALALNKFSVDEGNPHIRIKNPEVCKDCTQACTYCCPAGCYVKNESGTVDLTTDGCLECGTCRILCHGRDNLIWEYPRGGFGVSFKFG